MKEQISLLTKAIDGITDEAIKEKTSAALKAVEQVIKSADEMKSKNEGLELKVAQLDQEKSTAVSDMMKYKSIQSKATEKLTAVEKELEDTKVASKGFSDQVASLTKERDSLLPLKEEMDNQKRTQYGKVLKELSDKPNFGNFSKDLIQPDKDNPLESLNIEDIDSSLSKIEDWKNKGFIQIEDGSGPAPVEDAPAKTKFEQTLEKVFGKLD